MHTGENAMRTSTITIALIFAALTGLSHARIIHEDFFGSTGDAEYDSELNFDFGTDSDFAGFDSHDLFAGQLWLYADLTTVTVNTMGIDEWIQSIELTWTDNCGLGCTNIELFGDTMNLITPNTVVGQTETIFLTDADLGEQIRYFSLSSFEGRIDEFTLTIVPTPASASLLAIGAILLLPSRKR
jgi:hypothetical protein